MQTINWPFHGPSAVAAGSVTSRELRRFHEAVYPTIWVPRGTELSAEQLAHAAWLWAGGRGVLAGLSASAMLGSDWIDSSEAAELIHTNRRPPPQLVVHTDTLLAGETISIDGMAVTTPARTAFDLGRRRTLTDAVQRIDALMHATGLKPVEVDTIAGCHPGERGVRRLRRALDLVDDGAESPYESLARLALVFAGFPRPETQIEVLDEDGYGFARIDMGWREYLVGVEFDGRQHWTDPRQRDWDIERLAMLEALGWIIIRVSARMLHHCKQAVLARIGAALLSRGCPRTW